MKQNLVVAVGLCLGVWSCATPSTKANLPDYATTLTRQLATRAHMTEGQYDRVRKLHLQELAEVKRLKKQLVHQPNLLSKRLEEVQSRYQWELATILWPQQLEKLAPYQNTLSAQLIANNEMN